MNTIPLTIQDVKAVCDAHRCDLEADNLRVLTEIIDETPISHILMREYHSFCEKWENNWRTWSQ
jgi:hypothetical protein